MHTKEQDFAGKIKDFVAELGGFANTAEMTLTRIGEDLGKNKHLFSVFSDWMFTIRGTAQQLELKNVALIAGLGEEIAIKATKAETRAQIRRCMGALWDALTTVKYLLQHHDRQTDEEQQILINRLENTLKSFGGPRPKVNAQEIDSMLRAQKSSKNES